MVNISFQQERRGQISTLKLDPPQYTSSYFKRKTDESFLLHFSRGLGQFWKLNFDP